MKVLDCRGLACPEPVIRTRAALAEPGLTALQVIVDNDAARGNVTRFATNHGWRVASESRDGLHYLTLTPAGESPASVGGGRATTPAGGSTGGQAAGFTITCAAAEELINEPAAVDGSVVLITAPVFGRGDETLGAKLMSSFLYALAEAERVPAQILFVNGGVRLTTGDTPVKEHLQRLSERGTKIMSCGTCLDYYGLKDQLVIGEVTNMYSIVEACQRATRVITL